MQTFIVIASNLNRSGQCVCKLEARALRTDRRATDNSTFAIGGISCSADSFVAIESSVLRINISAENHAHSKSANC
jgi:hypothetical protein